MRKHTAQAPALLVMLVFALSGCAGATGLPEGGQLRSSGPWSDEVRQEYEKAKSPEIKEALRDGTISDKEYAEMTQRYRDCLSGAGISVTKYGFEGAVLNPPASMKSDEIHNVEARCSDESGEYPIAYFYVQMRANPLHKDLGQAVVDCFKRKGLVGPGYGLRDYQAGEIPSSDTQAVTSCTIDPGGRLGG